MRAMWHLAIKTLAGRPGRTVLLVLAVALAAMLTVAASAVVGTMSQSVTHIASRLGGLADLTVRHRFGGALSQSLLDEVRSWDEVDLAVARVEGTVTLRVKGTKPKYTPVLRGIEPVGEAQLAPVDFRAGRGLQGDDEVIICPRLAKRLDVKVGDVLEVIRTDGIDELTVVGLFERPELSVVQRPMAVVSVARAQALLGQPGRLDEISIRVRPGIDAEELAESHADRLSEGAVFRTSASARAGVNRYLRLAGLMLYVLTVVASLSSGFLILTSLTTAVTQQTREMAIYRCIGASRSQLAASQLAAGGLTALGGIALGLPLGLLAAYGLFCRFAADLPSGFSVNPSGLVVAVSGCMLAGLLGAAYPAFLAATARPLEAMTVRARAPRNRHVVVFTVVALALIAVQPVAMSLPIDGEWVVWFWAYAGLPAAFVGCFLLGVPLLVLIARGVAPLLGRALRLPRTLLGQSVLATPVRQGFTGSTLMVSLALLVAVWTVGRSISEGWFAKIKMPDAFAYRFPSFTEGQVEALRKVPAATGVCATTMFPVEVKGMQFGLKEISPPQTLFVATDIEAFVEMMDVEWHEGEKDEALARLAGGRALLVTKQWSTAHGVGVGTTMVIKTGEREEDRVEFEVVGVIGSTGIDMAAHRFGVRREAAQSSVSSVFGTRADAGRYFGVKQVNLIVISLDEHVTDEEAMDQLKEAAPGARVGTSRQMQERGRMAMGRLMAIASALAVGSLILASFGVGNLVVGEVTSRRYEFGVLRAIGSGRGLLGRLVVGQTLIIALVGCVSGTILGLELALVEREFHRRLVGIDYAAHLPWDVIAIGAIVVMVAAVGASLPAIWWLMRQCPRALLARRE